MQNKEYLAKQLHRAVQLFAQNTILDDSNAMEIADLYPNWEINTSYITGDIVKHGLNQDNETQLYYIVQPHISSETNNPEVEALYKKIGFTENNISIWTQPYGGTDAYKIGDIVSHNNKIWKCTLADGSGNNIWEPGIYGWEITENTKSQEQSNNSLKIELQKLRADIDYIAIALGVEL